MTSYNTIMLKSNPPNPVIYEKVAVAAFYPGHLLELDSDDKFKKHASSGQNVAPILFALEDDLQGSDIDDQYAATARARAWQPQPGDQVYAVLADGENVSKNALLESNGDGTLKEYSADAHNDSSAYTGTFTVYPNQVVAKADEAVNLSDSSGAESSGALGYDKRILVTIV